MEPSVLILEPRTEKSGSGPSLVFQLLLQMGFCHLEHLVFRHAVDASRQWRRCPAVITIYTKGRPSNLNLEPRAGKPGVDAGRQLSDTSGRAKVSGRKRPKLEYP